MQHFVLWLQEIRSGGAVSMWLLALLIIQLSSDVRGIIECEYEESEVRYLTVTSSSHYAVIVFLLFHFQLFLSPEHQSWSDHWWLLPPSSHTMTKWTIQRHSSKKLSGPLGCETWVSNMKLSNTNRWDFGFALRPPTVPHSRYLFFISWVFTRTSESGTFESHWNIFFVVVLNGK